MVSYNDKLKTLKHAVDMVKNGNINSIIVSGRPGQGKTKNVIDFLAGKKFTMHKGFTTPRGVFETIKANKNGIIVFDDCDSAFGDGVAANMLKAALDSYSERVISWNSSLACEKIVFNGSIIFITNIDLQKIDDAVKSRSVCIDISMSSYELDSMINQVLHRNINDRNVAINAYTFLVSNKDNFKNYDLRTAVMMSKIISAGGDWQTFIKATMMK